MSRPLEVDGTSTTTIRHIKNGGINQILKAIHFTNLNYQLNSFLPKDFNHFYNFLSLRLL